MFFGCASLALALLSVALAVPVVADYLQTGLVPRFPTAILSVGIMMVACLSMVCGLVLDTVTHSRRELKRLAYLEIPAPSWPSARRAVGAVAAPARRRAPAHAAAVDAEGTVPGAPLALS